jgi:hypothetical protein
LYPATLLKMFMVSRSFWVEFFRSLRYKIISSVNRDSLTTYLYSFYFFFLPDSLARNSKTMLNKSGEGEWAPLSHSWL